jgi:eukaryotic-like serine/threonine-protein kinase
MSENTKAQTKVGTINYMSPEVLKAEPYNKSADIYSLGLMMYKLLNNKRLPFMPSYPNPMLMIT